MILFDLANEAGFLDVAGLDVSERAFFLSEDLEAHWQTFCEHHGMPSIVVHAAFAGDDSCMVRCVSDLTTLQLIQQVPLIRAAMAHEYSAPADGIWVSSVVDLEIAYAIAQAIVSKLNFPRPVVEWVTSRPPN